MEEIKAASNAEMLTIGITIGDFNGIGPELILKLLEDARLNKLFTPVIYGSNKILNKYRKLFSMEDFQFFHIKTVQQAHAKKFNVLNCWEEDYEITPGKPTAESGNCALLALNQAVADLKAGSLHAVVTAPIHKANMPADGFSFPGQTEYFAHHFGAKDALMFLVDEKLKIATVTGHLPLEAVAARITRPIVQRKLDILEQTLKKDFGLQKPRIAVLGLNPHAGEEGKIGNVEEVMLKPLIQEYKNKGKLVFGPYSADGFFGKHQYKKFDAVLAMYHDQALIPFKTIAFDNGVNFTAGIDAVRTSPDHGTAFDIAGKNIGDESSFRTAIYLAQDIAKRRKEQPVTASK